MGVSEEEEGGGAYGALPGGYQGPIRGYRALGLRSGHVEVRVVKARVVEVRVRACGGVRGGVRGGGTRAVL